MVTNADNPDPDEIRQATDRVMEQLVKLVEVLRDEVAPIPSASNEFIHPRAELRMISTAGTMYGMPNKTTIYLPDDLKRALEREAKRRGCSEAQVVRDAVTGIVTRPRPNAGLFAADPFAERVDELLAGFGEQ